MPTLSEFYKELIQRRCEDCNELIPKNKRRIRCRNCKQLVCVCCYHHTHGDEKVQKTKKEKK